MKNPSENRSRMTKDQIVTVEDLEQFKKELIELFKGLIKEQSKPVTKQWLKSHEARKLLDISAGKLLTLRINGILSYTRIGGVIYYSVDDINKMFEDQKRLK